MKKIQLFLNEENQKNLNQIRGKLLSKYNHSVSQPALINIFLEMFFEQNNDLVDDPEQLIGDED